MHRLDDIRPASRRRRPLPTAIAPTVKVAAPRPVTHALISDFQTVKRHNRPATVLQAVKTTSTSVQSVPQPTPAPITTVKPRVDTKMSVAEHLHELRTRLTWSVVALSIGGIMGYVYNKPIIGFLVKPLNEQLYYTSPTGGFEFLIKICLFFGFLGAIPIIVYNLLRFVAPALPSKVSYKTGRILLLSTLLAFAGVTFAYYVSLPAALHFLNKFSSGYVTSLISANEYFTFVMVYLAGFAALFQMPLIMSFINKVTPLKPAALMKKQRVVILISFVIAAILTPTPDPLNQALMAAPIIGLYQTSVGVVWQTNRRQSRRVRRASTKQLAALAV